MPFRIVFFAGLMLALSGCLVMERGDNRHLQPIPGELLAEMAKKGMTPADPIMVRIHKKESELELWKRDRTGQFALLKTYPMCRWSGQLGPKKREGDRQAPEGFYTVTPDLMNPKSQFYLSFNLGYPNALERVQGFTGSALMVHGACTSAGCFAMTDKGIAEIYAVAREAFKSGNASFQVQALPFRMTAENLARHRSSPHAPYWRNLKEGADHFDATRTPPTVAVCERRYVFNAKTGVSLLPGQACPAVEVEASVSALVAEHRKKEDDKLVLLSGSVPAAPYSLQDGGMHPSFRRMLRSVGPMQLQAMTSGDVEISRPDAALADLYSPEPAASGSSEFGSSR